MYNEFNPLFPCQLPTFPTSSHCSYNPKSKDSIHLSLDVTSVVALLLGASLGATRRGRGRSSSRGSRGGRGRGSGLGSSVGSGGNAGGGSGGGGSSRSGGGGSRGGSTSGRGARGAEAQSGTGDGVGREVGVDVEDNALVTLGVERSTGGTVGELSAGAGNLEVEALGVVLGTVRVLGRVEGDDFVADDVVAGLEGGGDGDVPAEAVVNQLVRGPGTGVGTADETSLVDLDPGEGGLVDGGGVVGRGDVGDHGTVVLWVVLLAN